MPLAETPMRRLVGRVAVHPRASASVLLVTMLCMTAGATWFSTHLARDDRNAQITHDAQTAVNGLERRVVAYTEMLVGLRGLFQLDRHPSRERFGQFVRGLQLPARYPGVEAVSFAEAVDPVDLTAFKQRVAADFRHSNYPPLALQVQRSTRNRVIVDYVEPLVGNKGILGYDLLSERTRAAAVIQTQGTGQPAVTAPLRLIQDGSKGFLIVLAVRTGGALTDPTTGRLMGVTTAAFRADDFLRSAFPGPTGHADVEVYDLGAARDATHEQPSLDNLIYDADGDHDEVRHPNASSAALIGIDVAGRRWLVHYAPARVAAGSTTSLPLSIAGGGLAISILASWLLLILGLGRSRAMDIAAQMTADLAVSHRELQRTNRDLREAQTRFRAAFDDAPIGMALVGIDGAWLQVNHALCRIVGYTQDEFQAMTFQDITHPDDLHADLEQVRQLLDGETTGYQMDKRYLRRDDSIVWITLSVSLVRDVYGVPQHFIAQIEDITERRRADARFRELLEAAPDAMVIVDEHGEIVLVNSQTQLLFGYERDELVGQPVELLVPDRLRRHHRSQRDGYAADPHARPMGVGIALHARRKDGTELPVEISLAPLETDDGRLVSAAIRDVTSRREEEEKLRYLAEHDELTGLRNRRTFEHELAREAARSRRYRAGAMLLIDIDSLKDVNDTLGHAQGDELIRSVGALIAARVRATDIAARIGGDEFGVLMPDTSVEAAQTVAEDLLLSIRNHGIVLGAQRQRLTASIGVAGFGSAGMAVGEDVMVAADLALYEAKESGRDRVVIYAPNGHEAAERRARVSWSERLRSALDDGKLVAFRQPIMDLHSGKITQYELLVRMLDEDGTAIPPSAFLPTAERTGFIRHIDRFMVCTAIDLIAESAADGAPLTYEVNLSARSLADPELPDIVARRLHETGANPSRLMFEITETAAIANMEQARDFANALRELGCGFALDDFGAGFASFYYLKHMPLDCLKIDGDFVRHLTSNTTDQLVVRHIAEIARTLGLSTVAEFVEDDETMQMLAALGVDCVQGYYIGRPEPLLRVGV